MNRGKIQLFDSGKPRTHHQSKAGGGHQYLCDQGVTPKKIGSRLLLLFQKEVEMSVEQRPASTLTSAGLLTPTGLYSGFPLDSNFRRRWSPNRNGRLITNPRLNEGSGTIQIGSALASMLRRARLLDSLLSSLGPQENGSRRVAHHCALVGRHGSGSRLGALGV